VSREQIANRWQEHVDGHREMIVAEVDGASVGTVSYGGARRQRPESLRCFALDVGEAYRNRGIGTALLTAVEDEARRQSLSSVHQEVAVENTNAIRLYERLGYAKEPETIVDHWFRLTDDDERALMEDESYVMAKPL
jgi:ribosomal protein S18 acetylase RimI-like enzyme